MCTNMKKIRLKPTSWREHSPIYNTIPASVSVSLAHYFIVVTSLLRGGSFQTQGNIVGWPAYMWTSVPHMLL